MTIELQAQPAPDESTAAQFTPPPINHLDNVVYLVGTPIAHSSSPKLHSIISSSSSTSYGQVLAETSDLPSFLNYLRLAHPDKPSLLGTGVTMPHKVSVLPYLDHLTPEAKAIGAVNTIYFREGEWWGTNTDTIGIRDAFTLNVDGEVLSKCEGRAGLVVGGGGTCRTAIYTLQRMGCSKIYITNRDPEEVDTVLRQYGSSRTSNVIHVTSVEQAEELESPSLVVSAIPDFSPSSTSEWIVRDILSSFLRKSKRLGVDGAVLEMCYHPSPDTQITRLAQESGWRVVGGLEAMIAQGLEQARLWTGIDVTEGLREAAREAVRPKQ